MFHHHALPQTLFHLNYISKRLRFLAQLTVLFDQILSLLSEEIVFLIQFFNDLL
jgi:hypothetical protein